MKRTAAPKTRKSARASGMHRAPGAARSRRSPAPTVSTVAMNGIEDQPIPMEDQPDAEIPAAETLERARQLEVWATPSITKSIARQSKQGSYLHARILFDFAGFTAAQAPESASISPIVEMLLREMEMPPPKAALS